MNLLTFLQSYPVETPVIVVTEISGTLPIQQYNVNITGTHEGQPVDVNYTTSKDRNLEDLETSANREVRYSELATEAGLENTIETEVAAQIEVFDPTPTP